ncbi:hypothetical protein TBK1r_53200 [Stieleria magnilauensis]|uniref:Uncharacterized protein n=1 Tax=Stieleria magnilauensis TaxID=2527963 RepID=A0ABX5XYD3_9BACT|nr:hypothetical protein TBK1r_53200 [Planctomycetes bacterium TBK1r]
MTGESQPFANEGYAIMGAAFEVDNILGGGLFSRTRFPTESENGYSDCTRWGRFAVGVSEESS